MCSLNCGKTLADSLKPWQLNEGHAKAMAANVNVMEIDRHVAAVFYRYSHCVNGIQPLLLAADEERRIAGENGTRLQRYNPSLAKNQSGIGLLDFIIYKIFRKKP